jgi:hypothetical protein
MRYDHHNGKAVKAVTKDSITFSDGATLRDLLSVVPDEIVGTTLLKVAQEEAGVVYLLFGHSFVDRPSVVVATVEATGADLTGEDGQG